jgi:hypothetical protein
MADSNPPADDENYQEEEDELDDSVCRNTVLHYSTGFIDG